MQNDKTGWVGALRSGSLAPRLILIRLEGFLRLICDTTTTGVDADLAQQISVLLAGGERESLF